MVEHSGGAVPTFRTTFERDGGESASFTLLRAVAAVRGVEPTALPELSHYCDPDALDALFTDRADGTHRAGTVSLTYDGLSVTMTFADGTGELTIASPGNAAIGRQFDRPPEDR